MTNVVTNAIKLILICEPSEVDVEVFTTGGLSVPKTDAGVLEFNTDGGVTDLKSKNRKRL